MRLIDADALMEKEYSRLRDGDVLWRIPPSHIDLAPTIDAVHEASDGIISRRRNITAVCNGKRKSAYGYIWRWGQRKIETVLPKSDAKDERGEKD